MSVERVNFGQNTTPTLAGPAKPSAGSNVVQVRFQGAGDKFSTTAAPGTPDDRGPIKKFFDWVAGLPIISHLLDWGKKAWNWITGLFGGGQANNPAPAPATAPASPPGPVPPAATVAPAASGSTTAPADPPAPESPPPAAPAAPADGGKARARTKGAGQAQRAARPKPAPGAAARAKAPEPKKADIVSDTIQSIQSVAREIGRRTGRQPERYNETALPIYQAFLNKVATRHMDINLGMSERPAYIVAENLLQLARTPGAATKLKGVKIGGNRAFSDSDISKLREIAGRAQEFGSYPHSTGELKPGQKRLILANKDDAGFIIKLVTRHSSNQSNMKALFQQLPELLKHDKWVFGLPKGFTEK